MKTIQSRRSGSSQKSASPPRQGLTFTRTNYILLGISVLIILTGYVAMYLDNQVNSLTSLYIAPTLLMGGYLLVIYAILKREPSGESSAEQS